MASLIGRLLFLVWRSRRADAVYWASRALGLSAEHPQSLAIARRSFRNFAKLAADIVSGGVLWRGHLIHSELRQIKNSQVLLHAANESRGCLLVSAHFGNWELLGAWVTSLGRNLHVVALPLPRRSLNRVAVQLRKNAGFALIDTNGAASDILGALGRGDWVALLADRPVSTRGELVEFLGKRARHPIGAIRLAKRARVPVIVGACWSDDSGAYQGEIFDPINTHRPSVTAEDAMREALKKLEAVIKRMPDQWYIAYTSDSTDDNT